MDDLLDKLTHEIDMEIERELCRIGNEISLVTKMLIDYGEEQDRVKWREILESNLERMR